MSIFKTNVGQMFCVAVVAAAIGLGTGVAVAGQPQMDGALSALQSAQGLLNEVTMEKGGHGRAGDRAGARRDCVWQSARRVGAGRVMSARPGVSGTGQNSKAPLPC